MVPEPHLIISKFQTLFSFIRTIKKNLPPPPHPTTTSPSNFSKCDKSILAFSPHTGGGMALPTDGPALCTDPTRLYADKVSPEHHTTSVIMTLAGLYKKHVALAIKDALYWCCTVAVVFCSVLYCYVLYKPVT